MTIYVDTLTHYPDKPHGYFNWCHMASDGNVDELHQFAALIGLRRDWFQDRARFPHYDLTAGKRDVALAAGAVEMNRQALVEHCVTPHMPTYQLPFTLYTVGYQRWSIDVLAERLAALDAQLVDIRKSPYSQRKEFRGEALEARFGERYVHFSALGNKNYNNDGPIELVAPHLAVEPMRALLTYQHVVLLCMCPDPARCHRSVAAQYLAAQLGVHVEHLELPRLPKRTKTVKAVEQPVEIDWAARKARARRWLVDGRLMANYPYDHEPRADDVPPNKPHHPLGGEVLFGELEPRKIKRGDQDAYDKDVLWSDELEISDANR